MKPLQFYRAVCKMREKQRLYDRNHNPSALREAREWERVIDAEIYRVEQLIKEQETQMNLGL